jgi:Zn-dependent peptidase ImmA (M78 family)
MSLSDKKKAKELGASVPGLPESGGDSAEDREYPPLPADWGERAATLAETFASPRTTDAEEHSRIESFVHVCLRYAHMERRIQGEILCEIPAHMGLLRGDRLGTLFEEAESLARAERRNLGLGDGPIEDLAEALDERGIKVIESVGSARRRSGAFLFEEDTGPALLAMAPVASPVGRFVLAHAYCHLAADIDPYVNRHCPPAGAAAGPLARGGRLLDDLDPAAPFDETAVPETRADLFARALLMPREHLRTTLSQFCEDGHGGFRLERLRDVAFYYGVTTPMLLGRLVDLDLLDIQRARLMAAGLPAADLDAVAPQEREPAPAAGPDPLQTLPRRFVNLALALFLKREISREQLETLLAVEGATVDRLLRWIGPVPRPAAAGGGALDLPGA